MSPVLELTGVTFAYRRVVAVAGIDWSLEAPIVVGVLGPNGAGKTTLIRLLASVLSPQSGSISVSGNSLEDRDTRRKFRASLGYLPQDFGFWPGFTVRECVAYAAWLRGLAPSRANERTRDAIDAMNLSELAERRMRSLSGGQKRRVGLAQAIVNAPEVLLLDEPTAGLDPEQRLHFRQLMRSIGSSGIVLISTHLVEDVASVCDSVAVMDAGRILFTGSPSEMKAKGARQPTPGASEFEQGYLSILGASDN
ncbi:MAG: ABC transporter ATP-binding protein [Actinomycetota bacterium]